MLLSRFLLLLPLVVSSFAAQTITIDNRSSCTLTLKVSRATSAVQHHEAPESVAAHSRQTIYLQLPNDDNVEIVDLYEVRCGSLFSDALIKGNPYIWSAAINGVDQIHIQDADATDDHEGLQFIDMRQYGSAMVLVNAKS